MPGSAGNVPYGGRLAAKPPLYGIKEKKVVQKRFRLCILLEEHSHSDLMCVQQPRKSERGGTCIWGTTLTGGTR